MIAYFIKPYSRVRTLANVDIDQINLLGRVDTNKVRFKIIDRIFVRSFFKHNNTVKSRVIFLKREAVCHINYQEN